MIQSFDNFFPTIFSQISDWIGKYEKMVVVWKKQAETADKVTASLSTSDPDAPPMKLEDLEGHLNALKEMFIQKQKMMDDLEKTTGTIDNFSRIEFQVVHSYICAILTLITNGLYLQLTLKGK